jgi:adenylate kinase
MVSIMYYYCDCRQVGAFVSLSSLWFPKRRMISGRKLFRTAYACLPISSHPPIYFVLGGPGSGKGTQCGMLANKLPGLVHPICVGDLLRQEALQENTRGKWIASILEQGNIVPGFVTLGLLSRVVVREQQGRNTTRAILMDGFPRTLDQAIAFEQQIGTCRAVLYLECSSDVLKARLLQRSTTSGRKDDVARVIERRLETFERETSQVVEYYRKKGILRCFSGEGEPQVVLQSLLDYFQSELAAAVGEEEGPLVAIRRASYEKR